MSNSDVQSVRNSESALRHGQKCCELTEWNDVGCLEAIAAAYASLSDFSEAIRWQSKAVSLVSASQYDAAKAQLTEYENHL
jgi:serine/threonine-protein kinase